MMMSLESRLLLVSSLISSLKYRAGVHQYRSSLISLLSPRLSISHCLSPSLLHLIFSSEPRSSSFLSSSSSNLNRFLPHYVLIISSQPCTCRPTSSSHIILVLPSLYYPPLSTVLSLVEFIHKYNTMTLLNIVYCVPRVH